MHKDMDTHTSTHTHTHTTCVHAHTHTHTHTYTTYLVCVPVHVVTILCLCPMDRQIKVWITVSIPKIEDGNNFGVSIQVCVGRISITNHSLIECTPTNRSNVAPNASSKRKT